MLMIIAVVTLRTFIKVKPIYQGQIHKKFPELNSSRVLFYLGKKFWEGHITDIGSQGFHARLNFRSVNSRRQDAQESSRSKRLFIFYLTVISYANSTCKVKAGKDEDSCPQNFFHRGSYVWCYHQDLRRWASIGCNRRQNEVRHFAQNWAFLRFTYFKRRKHSFSSLIPSTQCCADVRSGKLSTSL